MARFCGKLKKKKKIGINKNSKSLFSYSSFSSNTQCPINEKSNAEMMCTANTELQITESVCGSYTVL